MEVNLNYNEEIEIRAIDDTLPSLHKKRLLTAIECRMILFAGQLPEKQSAIYRIIMSKNKQKAAKLVEVFRAMNYGLHSQEKLKLQESEHNHTKNELDSPLEANKNPMLIDTVIECVFGFLPLNDIKNCCVVSRQWNSTAEILLRKRAQIHFRPDRLRPQNFLAVSKFSLQKSFSAFKFSDCKDADYWWRESELEDFFERWGEKIKELNLDNINIECADVSSKSYSMYDITPWVKRASKITSLTIQGSEDDEVQLDMSLSLGDSKILPKIKTFKMKGNSIVLFSDKEIIRRVPQNIELSNIIFRRGSQRLDEFCYNDLFDFSQAATIKLNNKENNMSEVTFDMGDQVFKNTDLLHLDTITIKNWKEARGIVQNVELVGVTITEKSHLEIKSLQSSSSGIDLFVLPRTIERIELNHCDISCSEPFSLPKLKFLKINCADSRLSQFTQFQLDKCEALKELVFEGSSLTRTLDVRRLPINLQVLRIKGYLRKYLSVDVNLEIPALVVLEAEYGSDFSDYTEIAKKFRTGTLVVVCYSYMQVSQADIVKLLSSMEKEPRRIIIGMKEEESDLHSQNQFEDSLLSTMVDSKSNYYEFENLCGIKGKAITRDEFLNGCISFGNESIPYFLKDVHPEHTEDL